MPRGVLCTAPADAFKSQRGQDAWVLSTFDSTRFHYYVDLAAQEPACNSNTWALDQRGWKGLCVEASQQYVERLRAARSCTVVQAVVEGTTPRNASFLLAKGYGGLIGDGFDNVERDPLREGARAFKAINVTTRPLLDVLVQARVPPVVGYLSLDVEGAETRVLTADVLQRFAFLTMTLERPSPRLCSLLFAHGYLFVHNVDFDAYFIHSTHPRARDVERNETFEYLPAKCTPSTPHRITWLYTASQGQHPVHCSNAGYYTIYSGLSRYKGACCYHRDVACSRAGGGAAGDCTHLRYGQPTSLHAQTQPRGRTVGSTNEAGHAS